MRTTATERYARLLSGVTSYSGSMRGHSSEVLGSLWVDAVWMVSGLCAIRNEDPERATDVLDGVEELVYHSLLQHQKQSDLLQSVTQEGGEEGGPRFTMLETVREYAQEQLEASGEGHPPGADTPSSFWRLRRKRSEVSRGKTSYSGYAVLSKNMQLAVSSAVDPGGWGR